MKVSKSPLSSREAVTYKMASALSGFPSLTIARNRDSLSPPYVNVHSSFFPEFLYGYYRKKVRIALG